MKLSGISAVAAILVLACLTGKVSGYACSFRYSLESGLCWEWCPSNDGRWCYTGHPTCLTNADCKGIAQSQANTNLGNQCAAIDQATGVHIADWECGWTSDSGCVNAC